MKRFIPTPADRDHNIRSARFHTGWTQFRVLNGLAPGAQLQAGDRLKVVR
jgi:predicted Zn-dependent protease